MQKWKDKERNNHICLSDLDSDNEQIAESKEDFLEMDVPTMNIYEKGTGRRGRREILYVLIFIFFLLIFLYKSRIAQDLSTLKKKGKGKKQVNIIKEVEKFLDSQEDVEKEEEM